MLLAGLVFSLEVVAEISFEQLSRLADSPQQRQGSFVQEKYLSSVDASLSSSGKFAYRRGESIRWHILQPIESELLLTPEGIGSDGQAGSLLPIDSGNDPLIAATGAFLFALLTSDWQTLGTLFELDGEVSGQRWHAILVPREANLTRLFNRIEVSGAGLLEKIILHEAGGNRTTIHLDRDQ